jgi:hypothetical protein
VSRSYAVGRVSSARSSHWLPTAHLYYPPCPGALTTGVYTDGPQAELQLDGPGWELLRSGAATDVRLPLHAPPAAGSGKAGGAGPVLGLLALTLRLQPADAEAGEPLRGTSSARASLTARLPFLVQAAQPIRACVCIRACVHVFQPAPPTCVPSRSAVPRAASGAAAPAAARRVAADAGRAAAGRGGGAVRGPVRGVYPVRLGRQGSAQRPWRLFCSSTRQSRRHA